jgi:hypothetical protein
MTQLAEAPVLSEAPVATGCPFAHGAVSRAGTGGVDGLHAAGTARARTSAPIERSLADRTVRRLLRIRELPAGSDGHAPVRAFRRSMLLSTIRCSLTYLVFPFVLPALGLVAGTGVIIGLVIGVLAIACDLFTIRRFFSVDHKWRWTFSTIAIGVVCLLSVLLVQDVIDIVS